MDELMIKIDNVTKEYRLGAIGGGTLQGDIQSWWAQKRGKEDPNRKLGEEEHKKNERFKALDGVSFEVRKGERVGIIGHNGAGKSTLLKLLSRITAPTSGEIGLNGRIASMLEVGTGFHPELTGRENIYMNGAILGMSRSEIDVKMEDIIDFSECRKFIDTPVKRYSSGMYVKLAFSVAAHLDSEIMIMDEVLAVGDMAFQKKCLEKMSQVSESEERTILYVSHNMNTIRQLCNRVIMLDNGNVVYNGEVENGIEKYLGIKNDELPVTYNLLNTQRPSEQHGKKLRIVNFSFLKKEKAVFKRLELVRFSITFTRYEILDEIKLYFVLMSNNGEIIGMTQTFDPIDDIKQNQTVTCEFSVDCSNLIEDAYILYLDVFVDDGHGKHYSVDHPLQPIAFRIIDDNPIGINWNKQYYGHLRLNPIIKEK